ncbi:MAG TPA: ABC transporter ATP-binding protein, partial [Firmicutes bacterium]|nr:ABC transporter ATP-binding protein [Bacillota bacterium]
YNEEIYEIKRFEDKLKDYENKYKKWRIFSSFFFSSSDIFIFATSAIAIIYSLYLVYKKEITEGTLVVAYTFINMIVWPLRDTATMLSNLGQAFASADRIKKLFLEEEEDINSGIEAKINGDIEFKNVSFAYQDRKNQYALKNISFSIKKGQTVAILGKTGSGKSTLLLLLTRLFDPSQGHIYLDGIDITKISKRCVRKNIVPVLQDPFLFSKSIKDNIALSNENASDSDIYKATKIADLDKTIEGFEKGFDTPVGEKGVTLSGGQKQRVAIARTVLSKASVMIFDDSLSAVDSKTDLNIRKSLANLDKRTTKIIITSRINSAKSADKIIVLDKGQIEEIGTHEELIKNNGLYEKLDKIQERRQ